MKYFFLSIPLVIILGVSSLAHSNRIEAFAINEQLIATTQNPDATINVRRQDLRFVDGQTVNNCKKYWRLMESIAIDESQTNQIARSNYLECDALALMQRSLPVDRENLNLERAGKDLLQRLNLRSFLSSVSRLCQTDRCHLAQLFPEYVSSNATVARYESDDWLFIMEVVAAVNLDDNDNPDWIIWVVDEAKMGSYRSYFTLIVYDPADTNELKAVMHPLPQTGNEPLSAMID